MRVFVTGASGFIGSHVVPELIRGGHQVIGLARNDANAQKLSAAGVEVHRGDLEDVASLRAGAAKADAVIHLAFIHDFSRFAEVAAVDARAIEALCQELEGSNRPLCIASGVMGAKPGQLLTEDDSLDGWQNPRIAGNRAALDYVKRGVRTSIMRLSPSIHGHGDEGFMHMIAKTAQEKGFSAYVGDGNNRWPACHVLDAARLFRLAIEKAPAGAAIHAVADEGVPIRDVAAVIGKHLDLPVKSIAPDEAAAHFTWMAHFIALDSPASNAKTRALFDWTPTHPGLIADLDEGHYFTALKK